MKITLVAGDTRPLKLAYELDRKAADITGYQFALIIMYQSPITIIGTIVDAAKGYFAFPFTSGQLQAGTVPYRIRETDPAGTVKTHLMGDMEILT